MNRPKPQNHLEAAQQINELLADLVGISKAGALDLAEDKAAHSAFRLAVIKAATGLTEARIILETW